MAGAGVFMLTAKGIQTGIHYPFPLHTLKAFDFLGYKQGQVPNAEKAAAEVLLVAAGI